MATLKDLSRHLGLSVTQVSRAMNNHSDVSDATRKRVHEAAAELGYAVNVSARKLKAGRSGIVGMIVSDADERDTPDLLYSLVIGISAAFSRSGMQFVLHVMAEAEEAVDTHARLYAGGLLDGFVVVNPEPDDPRVAFLRQRGIPFVVHGRDQAKPDYPFVDIDNAGVLRTLTDRALSAGHRDILLLNGPMEKAFARTRATAFDEAMTAAGVPPDGVRLRSAAMVEQEGAAAVEEFLAADAPAPTAIIAGNMMLAAGVCEAIARAGLSIPGDISVLAHDDCLGRAPADSFSPALTRTVAPLREAWDMLSETLAGAIAGRKLSELQRILPTRVVEGASVAPPPERQPATH